MSIFISYRRTASKHLARLIFQELRARGYDVFLDVSTIDSGAFDRLILNQIAARPHFLLILSPGSLERCANAGDWLRREIEEAFRLKRNIVPIFDEGFNIEREKQYLPEPLRTELARLNAPPYSNYYFDAFIETLCNRFLKQPAYNIPLVPISPADRAEVQRRIEQATIDPPSAASPVATRQAVSAPNLTDLLPPPFDWSMVLPGRVTLVEKYGDQSYLGKKGEKRIFNVPAFAMSKYPITNGQFARFVEAQGYEQRKWWTEAGWHFRTQEKWLEPLYWRDKKWNQQDYPVVGISWFEAVAFCKWLSEVLGEPVMLPAEQQWQRAAQGDDGRDYPWGNRKPDKDRSNFNQNVGRTTPVNRYPTSASPYGVIDMSGNVWEWCLTEYESGKNDVNGVDVRVLRGGAWSSGSPGDLRADFRYGNDPLTRNIYTGARFVRPL